MGFTFQTSNAILGLMSNTVVFWT